MQPVLSISRRTRSTPFTRRVTEAGVKGYTVYNRMLLPTVFEDIVADYRHLKTHVQVWDVAVERQVEIIGPDAGLLVQMLTPRSLANMADDQCYYIPVVDQTGGMLNDPVAVKHTAVATSLGFHWTVPYQVLLMLHVAQIFVLEQVYEDSDSLVSNSQTDLVG